MNDEYRMLSAELGAILAEQRAAWDDITGTLHSMASTLVSLSTNIEKLSNSMTLFGARLNENAETTNEVEDQTAED